MAAVIVASAELNTLAQMGRTIFQQGGKNKDTDQRTHTVIRDGFNASASDIPAKAIAYLGIHTTIT